MKVILETADLIRIIGAHFGAEFDADNVTIRTDPFEVEVRGIDLPDADKPTPSARPSPSAEPPHRHVLPADADLVAQRADDDATIDPPPPGMDETEALNATGSPAAIIQRSRELENELEGGRRIRRKGGSTNAPKDFQDEVS